MSSRQLSRKNASVAAFIRRRSSAPQRVAILLAEEYRFRHGKVRDQVELLVNNADAQRFNRRGIAERQRLAVERGVAAILDRRQRGFLSASFSCAVLADQAVNFTGFRSSVTAFNAVTLAKLC